MQIRALAGMAHLFAAALVTVLCLACAAPGPAGATARDDRVLVPPRPPVRPSDAFFGAILSGNSPGWAAVLPTTSTDRGALVLAVVPGSPAAGAGIAAGDVVVEVDGVRVVNDEMAQVRLRTGATGRRLVVATRPDGRVSRVPVELTETPALSADAYLRQRLMAEHDAVSRFLVAQTTADPAVGLRLARELVLTNPGLGPAHEVLALRLFEDAVLGSAQSGVVPADRASEVERAIVTAAELNPDSAAVHLIAARIAVASGQLDRARAEAARAVEIDDSSARALLLLGQALLTLGRPADALPHLHEATMLNPFDANNYTFLIQAYDAVGRAEDARRTRSALDELLRPGGQALVHRRRVLALSAAALVLLAVGASLALPRGLGGGEGDGAREPRGAADALHDRTTVALEAAVAFGAWAAAAPYVAPQFGLLLDTPERLHLADHLLPGAVAVLVAVLSLRSLHRSGRPMLFAPNALFLVGLWITATHVGLVAQAVGRSLPVGPAIAHVAPGLALFAFSIWLYLAWGRAGPGEVDGLLPPPAAAAQPAP